MSRRRRFTCVALLGAVLQFCASAVVAAQVTVCRSPDGHVEIGSALDGDCCPTGDPRRRVDEVRATRACDGCIDAPLLRAGLSAPLKDALAAMACPPRGIALTAAAPRLGWTAPLAAPDVARPRRSLVLLI